MADRKSFLLRADASVLEAMQRWANDDLRSLNAQVEYVLRAALRSAGRLPGPAPPAPPEAASPEDASRRGSGGSGESGG